MKKAVIHGANPAGKKFMMRADNIFDFVAFVDRASAESEFDGVPIYSNFSSVPDKNIDYIFVSAKDYDGVLKEYEPFLANNKTKTMSIQHGHQLNKQWLICGLANEIHRRCVPGSAAELGVDRGDTAKYINLFFEDRTLYLFDTFEGFAESDVKFEKSISTITDRICSFYDNRTSEAEVLDKMYYPARCIIKKGLFPESLYDSQGQLEDTFALVHIDCDLQKPILSALEYFYPRLSEGGYICVHDYFNPNFTAVRKTVRDFVESNSLHFVAVPNYDGVVICR